MKAYYSLQAIFSTGADWMWDEPMSKVILCPFRTALRPQLVKLKDKPTPREDSKS